MKFKTILFFLSFFIIFSVASQSIEDLEQIRALQEIASMQSIESESDLIDKESQEFNQLNTSEKQDNKTIKTDDIDFGFMGTENFLISPAAKTINKKLQYFGYDYFDDINNTLEARSDIPIPPDYVLGVGDEIKIIFYGNNNKKYSLEVNRDGDIFLPELGPVSVAGLTFKDLKEIIRNITENQLIGTQVSLTLGSLRSINIYVLGEASQPGMYTVSALSSLTNAIFLSGGIKTTGSLRNIQLKRKGKILTTFDFYQLLLNGDTSNDSRLMEGDVVFIPPITKKVGVSGEIERPGIYELLENETATELINYAGTLKPKANMNSIEIQRIDTQGKGFNLLDINLQEKPFSALLLSDGDILTIYPIVDKLNKAILLSGHIPKPGYYPWKPGMTLADIIQSKDDLLPMTDMKYLLIKREDQTSQKYLTLQRSLENLFESTESITINNPLLNERDEVIFFPSQLSLNQIETKLLDVSFNNKTEEIGIEYLKSSLNPIVISGPEINTDTLQEKDQKFFSYSVLGYCSLAQEQIKELLTSDVSQNPQNIKLTGLCRTELLKPIISILEQQASSLVLEQTSTVIGNVRFPGKYPLTKGATVMDIVSASGGLKDFTFRDEIEINRKNFSGKVSNSKLIKGTYQEVSKNPVQPLDIVNIKRYKSLNSLANITGEVFFPGEYSISENETVNDLITRAGGLTDLANTKNMYFTREDLAEQQWAQIKQANEEISKMLLQNSQGDETNNDTKYLERLFQATNVEEENVKNLGRLIFEYSDINLNQEDSILLKDGDKLFIPSNSQSVSVIGEVYSPNAHLFDQQRDIDDYIELSGGLNDFASSAQIYIVKGNGFVYPKNDLLKGGFFRNSDIKIEPGDTIVVPIEIRSYEVLRTATDITQVIYQMAIAAAAVNSF